MDVLDLIDDGFLIDRQQNRIKQFLSLLKRY
jgi:hypothetical protein